MKKRLLTVGLLIQCLVLSACIAKDSNNLFEITGGNPADATAATIATTESTEPIEQSGTNEFNGSEMFEERYQYGNMQKNIPSGGYMRLDNQVIFSLRSKLYYYNLLSGTVTPFCNDATCTHKDNKCGTLGLSGNLEVYKGKVYALSGKNVAEYKNGGKEKIAIDGVKSFWHHNDQLYIQTTDMSLIVYDEGTSSHRVVLDEFVGYWSVIFDNYLYYSYSGIHRINLTDINPEPELICENVDAITDGNYIYYVDWASWKLHRCNMDGSNSVVLVDQPVLAASMNFDDEYFYYRLYTDQQLYGNTDCHDVYRFPKDDPTRIEKIITLEEAAYQVFTVPGTGKIFVHTIAAEGEEGPIYVMNTDGINVVKLEIPEY